VGVVAAATVSSALVLLHGVVTIAPSPSCHAGPRCTKPAAHFTLTFFRTRSTPDSALAMATTDARGRYSVALAPGTWIVRGIQGQAAIPTRIFVRPVRALTRNFTVSSGKV
jgi:hypothetical protein